MQAKLAAERLTVEDLDRLDALIKDAQEFHDTCQFDEVILCNTEFHDIIIQKCGNSRLEAIIEKIRTLILLSRTTEFRTFKRNDEYKRSN